MEEEQETLTEEEKELLKLKEYITNQRRKGFTDEHITKILVKKGLDDDIIERLYPKPESLSDTIGSGMLKGFLRIVGLVIVVYAIIRIYLLITQ